MVPKNKNQIKVFLDGFLKLKNKKTFEINRNIEKNKMEKKKKISGAQWFVLSYKIKKIKFFLGNFLKFSFLKIFFPKKKNQVNVNQNFLIQFF